jgi:hypothetical protein
MTSYDDWKSTDPRDSEPMPCRDCGGSGSFEVNETDPIALRDDPYRTRIVECENCKGSGWV